MKDRKPVWWALYLLLPIAIALLVAVERLIPAGGGRGFAEVIVSFAILGGMALWVRANRVALHLSEALDEGETPFRAWVAYQPPFQRREVGETVRGVKQRSAA